MVDILQKRQRSDEESKYLISAVLGYKIFDEAREHIQQNEFIRQTLEKNLNYEFFSQKSEIFRCGEFGNKFYIIISGKVDCLIPKKVHDQIQSTTKIPLSTAHSQQLMNEIQN